MRSCLVRQAVRLGLAMWLISAVSWSARAQSSAAITPLLSPETLAQIALPAPRNSSAPALKPSANLDLSFTKETLLPAPGATSNQFGTSQQSFNIAYNSPLSVEWTLQARESLQLPQDEVLNEFGTGQGKLAISNFTLGPAYESADNWSFKPYYSQSSWRYQDAVDALNQDRSANGLGLDASWQLTGRTKLTASSLIQEIEYSSLTNSYRNTLASIGLEQGLTAKLKAAANIGTELRDNYGGDHLQSPRTDFNFSYTLPNASTLTVGRRYALKETFDPDYCDELTEAYYSKLSQTISPRLKLDTTLAREFDERSIGQFYKPGQTTRDEYWQVQLAPSYKLNDELSAQLGYSLKVFTTPALPNQPLDNSVFLSLKLVY